MKPLLALGAGLLFSTLALSGVAQAGTLQVRDETHTLSREDVAQLRSVLGEAPFDARLVFTSAHPDAQDLARFLVSVENERDIVVVGVDPEHHHVQVRFGTGSRIPSSAWPAIEHAGNDAFRRGDWEGGAAAIFREASRSVASGAVPAERAAPEAGPHLGGPGLVLVVIVGVIGIGLVAAFLLRRREAGAFPGGGAGYGGYGPPPYGGPGYGGPPAGGMGPVGGGLIGAGLGGLAGYELGKLEGEREERDREDRFGGGGGGGGGDDGGGGFDAGGGGSDWDDGGGGGFDGGGDGGGGGSDF
jgi:hypothetical protein